MLARCVRWIFHTDCHMCISLAAPIIREQTKRRHKSFPAILASKAVDRIHLTLHCVGVSSARVQKELATKADIRRVLLTTHLMAVSLPLAIISNAPHKPDAGDEELLAKGT